MTIRREPVFTHFGNESLHIAIDFNAFASSNTGELLSTPFSQSLGHLIAAQIPALSDPAGYASTQAFGVQRNKSLPSFKADWPMERKSGYFQERWLHSDLKNISYRFVYPLYEDMVSEAGLAEPVTRQ